jgi:arginine-tRNA-protein transferase
MKNENEEYSVQIYGAQESDCGYCKNTKTSCSYGVLISHLDVGDYEKMMMVGWRRSGTYLYKPSMSTTCCPSYSIRLNVSRSQYSKSQKLLFRRMKRYLDTGDIHPASTTSSVPTPTTEDDATASLNTALEIEKHNLTVETVVPVNTPEIFELYKKYQVTIHNDKSEEVTEEGFQRFIVETPLCTRNASGGGSSASMSSSISTSTASSIQSFGTFHQLYRLDGVLVAVSVLDILPSGVSSVYVFYDPEKRDLCLGKYTALREIEYTKSLGLPYYYMGFYIHSCVKMRYKAEYRPSELLCPTTFSWYDLDKRVLALLDLHKFSPLEPHVSLQYQSAMESSSTADLTEYKPRFSNSSRSLNALKLLIRKDYPILSWNDITAEGQEVLRPMLTTWLENIGPELAKNFVLRFY